MSTHLPDYFLADLAVTFAFGIIAIFLLVLGYKMFDRLTPKLHFDDNLRNGNVAAAIVIGSFLLGLCYVIAHVISAILGGA
jgi:putative membrane protein